MNGNLVVGRKPGESLTLFFEEGEKTVIEVVRTRIGGVTLAIRAPQGVQIVRTELLEPDWDVGQPVG